MILAKAASWRAMTLSSIKGVHPMSYGRKNSLHFKLVRKGKEILIIIIIITVITIIIINIIIKEIIKDTVVIISLPLNELLRSFLKISM
jgi:hypothetical protein